MTDISKLNTLDDFQNEFTRFAKDYVSNNPVTDEEDDLFFGDSIASSDLDKIKKKTLTTVNPKENILFMFLFKQIGIVQTCFLITDQKIHFRILKPPMKFGLKGVIGLHELNTIQFEGSGFSGEGEFQFNGRKIGLMMGGSESADYLNNFFNAVIETNLFMSWREKIKSDPGFQRQVLTELQKHKQQLTSSCSCGYTGSMGVVGKKPWFIFNWVFIIIGLFLGVVPGLIMIVLRYMTAKKNLQCPQCKNELIV